MIKETPPTCASLGTETVFEGSLVDFEDLSVLFESLVFDADLPFESEVDVAAPLFEADAES